MPLELTIARTEASSWVRKELVWTLHWHTRWLHTLSPTPTWHTLRHEFFEKFLHKDLYQERQLNAAVGRGWCREGCEEVA